MIKKLVIQFEIVITVFFLYSVAIPNFLDSVVLTYKDFDELNIVSTPENNFDGNANKPDKAVIYGYMKKKINVPMGADSLRITIQICSNGRGEGLAVDIDLWTANSGCQILVDGEIREEKIPKQPPEKTYNHSYYKYEYGQSFTHTFYVSGKDSITFMIKMIDGARIDFNKAILVYRFLNKKLSGVGYGPYRDNESPNLNIYPTQQELREDILFLKNLAFSLRSFGVTNGLDSIPIYCQEAGIDCHPGVWIDSCMNENERGIQKLIEIANKNLSCVKSLIVGSEVLLRGKVPEDTLLSYIKYVKSKTNVSVSTSETWSEWLLHPRLAQQVDYILINVYPYWEEIAVEQAANHVVDKWERIKTQYPGKTVIIGETGWPSQGAIFGKAIPSEENQKKFLSDFLWLAEEKNIPYFYFEAFDEKWKEDREGSVGSHWGLYYSNGSLKPLLKNLVPPEARNGINRQPRQIPVLHYRVTHLNTCNNSTVTVSSNVTIVIDGRSFTLASGDEIALYTPLPDTICCGVGVWYGSNIEITVWGDNDLTPAIKEGFTSGQDYTFHVWDASESKEYRFGTATFSSGQSTYSINGISIVNTLNFSTVAQLSISLSSGWNMISSNVKSADSSLTSMFNAIVSSVVLVKNGLGKVYWPEYGINQIGNWKIVEGYMVYMRNAATLTMQGQRVNPSTPISLPTGWSMIAYLPNVTLSPATALASLGDKVVIMKDVSGKVYWPRYSIDQIGTMQVGKGYQIYLSSAGTLTYPASVSKEGNPLIVEGRKRGQLNPRHFSFIRGTGSNATILMRMNEKPVINGIELEIGDEIGVFTPEGICAGAGVWNGDEIVITVWGDNGETTTIDGFAESQLYNFKLWDKSANAEKDISMIAESGNLTYSENGITIISYEKSSVLPDNFVLRQNYPNPFNPTTRIEYQIKIQSEITLAIYNTVGQLIRMLVQSSQPAGVYSVEWDGRNSSGIQVPSGIYLYRLRAGSVVAARKMVMMK